MRRLTLLGMIEENEDVAKVIDGYLDSMAEHVENANGSGIDAPGRLTVEIEVGGCPVVNDDGSESGRPEFAINIQAVPVRVAMPVLVREPLTARVIGEEEVA